MRIRSPVRLSSRVSRYSVLALLGLVGMTAFVIAFNPFAHSSTQQSLAKGTTANGGTMPSQLISSPPPAGGHGDDSGDHHRGEFGNATGFSQFDD